MEIIRAQKTRRSWIGRWPLASLGVLALGFTLPTLAQIGPTAGQINTTILGDQIEADVAIAPDGTTLVVWSSEFTIRGRLFDATGQPAGPDFELNDGEAPAVAVEPDGGFVVVWKWFNFVQARRLSASGVPIGPQFEVGDGVSNVEKPDVAVAPTGEMMVTWRTREIRGGPTAPNFYRIEMRHFDAAGIGGETLIVDEVSCEMLFCDNVNNGGVVSGANGEFVVAWERNLWYLTPLSEDILVTRFAADGSTLGLEMVIANDTEYYHDSPSISYADDHYLVVWDSDHPMADGAGRGVRGRLLDAAGDLLGDELQINTSTLGDQRLPKVSRFPSLDPEFLVVWQDDGATPITARAQKVGIAGLSGPEQTLTTLPPGDEGRPAADQGTVVWDSFGSPGDDDQGTSIQGRALARPFLFADGFESGDTSAWGG